MRKPRILLFSIQMTSIKQQTTMKHWTENVLSYVAIVTTILQHHSIRKEMLIIITNMQFNFKSKNLNNNHKYTT